MPIFAALLVTASLTSPLPHQTKKSQAASVKPVDRNKAVIGQYYPLGQAGSKLNFKVTEAWYSLLEPRNEAFLLAENNQKLITLHVEIQNADKVDVAVWSGVFPIKVTGADNQSQTPDAWFFDVTSGKPVNQALRPLQKINALLTVPVTADGPVNKLFVNYANEKPLVYDFRGKAKDNLGAWSGGDGIVKPEINAVVGTPFTLDEWQFTIDEVIAPKAEAKDSDGYATAPTQGLTYRARIKNLALVPRGFYSGAFAWNQEDENGQTSQDLNAYYGTGNTPISGEVAPGKEIKASLVFAYLGPKVTAVSGTAHLRKVNFPLP